MPISLRLDLTEGKIYTLSPSTKRIVRDLKNPVTIKVFFSDPDQLPESLISVRQDVFDIVAEYEKIGRGKIFVEKFNPSESEEYEREALSFGVPRIQFNQYGLQSFEVSTGFGGLAIVYRDDFESIPFIENINNLEFEITAAIKKLTQQTIPLIGVITNKGGDLAQEIKDELRKQYTLQDVTLTEDTVFPEDMDGLILVGATDSFSDRELFLLDQFVMRGGKLFVFHDGAIIDRQYLISSSNDLSINTLLESYGVRINNDIVVDPIANESLAFRTGFLTVRMPYPPFPKVFGDGLNRENVITEKLQSLSFPFPSSLTVVQENLTEGTQVIELAKTTERSFTIDGSNAILTPDQIERLIPVQQGSALLAVILQGVIESAYSGKDIPLAENTSSQGEVLAKTDSGAVFVVGTSRMVGIDGIGASAENLVFFANALEVLVQGETLVDIRSRALANRPLMPLDKNRAAMIKYGNILASAFLSILVGGTVYFWRKRNDRRARMRYT